MGDKDKAVWIRRLARFGYLAKGIIYLLLGLLTSMAALGFGGAKANRDIIFVTILDGVPLGKLLLALLAVGLFSHSAFRFAQAFLDTEEFGTGAKAIARRLGLGASGIMYFSFAVYAIQLIMEIRRSNLQEASTERFYAGKVLSHPLGHWLIGIISLVFFGRAVWKVYKAFNLKLDEKLREGVHNRYQKVIDWTAKAGYISRGIVFGIIGYFFLRASINSNPREIKGMRGAFDFLEGSLHGGLLLGSVALGLTIYGIFMFVKAFLGKFNVKNFDD
jgi:hypothetical protein